MCVGWGEREIKWSWNFIVARVPVAMVKFRTQINPQKMPKITFNGNLIRVGCITYRCKLFLRKLYEIPISIWRIINFCGDPRNATLNVAEIYCIWRACGKCSIFEMGVDNQFHYQHANCLCAVKAKAKLKMTENCGIYNNHLPFQHNPHAIGIFCNAIMDKNYTKIHTSKSPPGNNITLCEMRSAKNV